MDEFEENIRRAAEKVHRLNGVGASKEEIRAAVGGLLELQGGNPKETPEPEMEADSPVPKLTLFGKSSTASPGADAVHGMSQKEYEASIEKARNSTPAPAPTPTLTPTLERPKS